MDESYLLATARYVGLNPIAAGIVSNAGDYQWSSAEAHLSGRDNQLTKVAPLLALVDNWGNFLSLSSEDEMNTFRKHERSGRPLGRESFVESLEGSLARILSPQKRGPKPKEA